MKNDAQTVNEILNNDADKLLRGSKLMPVSLAKFLSKRHYLPVEECFNRFDQAIDAIKDHKEAFSFIPEEWAAFMIEVQLNVATKSNPSNERYIDELIKAQARRLAWITRIVASSDEYEQEELLELNMKELEEVLDDVFPSEKKMDKGSFGRGFYKNAA